MRFLGSLLLFLFFTASSHAQFGFPDFSELTEQLKLFNENIGLFSGATEELTASIDVLTEDGIPGINDLGQGITSLTEQIGTTTQSFTDIAKMYEPQVAAFNQNAEKMVAEANAFNGNFAELNQHLGKYYELINDPKTLFKAGFATAAGATAGAIVTGFVLNGVLHLVTSAVQHLLVHQREKGRLALQLTTSSLETVERLVSFDYAFESLKLYLDQPLQTEKAEQLLFRIRAEQEEFNQKLEDCEDPQKTKAYRAWIQILDQIAVFMERLEKVAQMRLPLLKKRINDYKIKYFQIVLSLTLSYDDAFSYLQKQNKSLLKQVRGQVAKVFKGMSDEQDDRSWLSWFKERFHKGAHHGQAKDTLAYIAFEFETLNEENHAYVEEFLELVWNDLNDEAELFAQELAKLQEDEVNKYD